MEGFNRCMKDWRWIYVLKLLFMFILSDNFSNCCGQLVSIFGFHLH
jgi:hypothetical protein